ncbi:Hsp20/alpha crystallin family protein [Pelagicoccus sp. NFK12]|uniref:Hsp20/alpha crystallin family protein n=1 Tax=Pelagicoccus enzymogenes TaxID=2773457 RepID=A0A927IIG1_9BACT|nr:Hsp20/alpha crystallin family protein [Pelagicoccus enzymogenes]MBD5781231.1 Hsp20/alpha crystallin family protein [Pelagicoccus enzymogenes]MDQ8198867.1 Hsp20/alpha crystallin family protein [Pelagicoccus enzymogenes]
MNSELATTQNKQATNEEKTYRKPEYVVHSEDNAYRLEVHLPGVPKDGARITLDGNLLSIDAEAVEVARDEWKTYRRERPDGDFRLSLELNVDIDESEIKAKVENGVLTVNLPLAAKAAKRTIAIE